MAASNCAGKTDAELMRFCSATSKSLTDLSRRIVASEAEIAHFEAEYERTADLLNAALAILESRYCEERSDKTGASVARKACNERE